MVKCYTVTLIYVYVNRYKAYKERMQRMYVMPRYDPVFVEPNLKEYETQVNCTVNVNNKYIRMRIELNRINQTSQTFD